jgi:hypothetical protein
MIAPDSDRIPLYTAPHELFHVIQNGYKTSADLLYVERRFWYEATAEWATHQYLEQTSQSDTNYASNLRTYLSAPMQGLEAFDDTVQRQYGVFIFGEYLQEHYGNSAVRRTWEFIETGNAADEAFKNLATEHSETLESLMDDYHEFVYRFEFIDPAEVTWRGILENGNTAGDDRSSLARPARDSSLFNPGQSDGDDVSIDPGGMAYIDLAPNGDLVGSFHVNVTRGNDDIMARLVSWGSYPADCEVQQLAFTDNHATATINLPLGCTFATLILSHVDPLSTFGTSAEWDAEFSATAGVVDDFNRSFTPAVAADTLSRWLSRILQRDDGAFPHCDSARGPRR